MDPGCGKCLSSDCKGFAGYTDPDCPVHGKQKEPKSFVVTFNVKLEKRGERGIACGISPVVPLELVKKFDIKKNTLTFMPCMLEEKDNVHHFKFENHIIFIDKRKISDVTAV